MSSVVLSLLEMLRLRARPQDLPASDALVLATLAAVALASLAAVAQMFPLARSAARVACDLLVQFALVRVALQATGRGVRFRQVFAAICGTSTLFVLIALPLYGLVGGDTTGKTTTFAAVLLLAIYVWSVVVTGHILRHAFDVRLGAGVALALVYVVVTVLLGELIVPAPETG